MTIENLKQIAIKYATTKGSRVPLAPDELCNAVVQYFNEFLKITADINTLQVAVTEEGGNIVFTITGNTLDGKAFTPIVITVDHNDFVTNQEFEEFKTSVTEQLQEVENKIPDTSNLATKTELQEVESKIPDTTNFADVTKANTFADVNHFTQYITSFGVEIGAGNADDDEYDVSIQESVIEIFHYISGSKANSLRITENKIMTIVYPSNDYNIFDFPNKSGTLALTSDIPEYTNVNSVSYDSTNGAIVAYDGANEIHIPLLAGENATIDASEDNKKIVISAAGGGGTGDVTAAGNNTFTGENTFNNSIYAKNGVVVGDTTNYGANSVTKGSNTYSFPNKSGTFAMTTDIIKAPIYFISFYANEPIESCHLIGTMMSKKSYGTGQKTNEEFAVMLADNLYTNSNEGLAAYGKLAKNDILCIYSEDGLSISCLDEANSEVDLPTVMFFVMETEL